ncbi:MAG: hypothetical protein GIX03_14210 [Candidatus Eremiobacteraeota bacterium]|nr:hypothetical protein [Candidatus Eremiobacteraeota bacterium]MBC5804122.1 hypothetical protein [Candidatus Eremiobacteraeota bacterium]MBC5821825.1 hypothetical protein [Candidatus Eremiobacteraeota bacterium]
MLAPILIAALASSGHGHCLDSYLALGMNQQRPARQVRGGRVPSTAGDTVTRIDQVVAPPGHTIGFLYTTADGGRFFGTRTRAHEPAVGRSYVRRIFARDGLVSRAQLDNILANQGGNAIIYVPNQARLFPRLGLSTQACASPGTST